MNLVNDRKKHSVFQHIKIYMLATVLTTFFNFGRNIISARLLGPYLTGICLTFLTIPQIFSYLSLSSTLTVVIPYSNEKKNILYVQEIKNIIFNYSFFMSTSVFCLISLYAVFFVSKESVGYVVLASSLVVFWEFVKFFSSDLAAEKEFNILSLLEFFIAFLTFIVSCITIYYYKAYGFWLGLIIPNILALFFCFHRFFQKNIITLNPSACMKIYKSIPLGVVMLISSAVYLPFIIATKLFLVTFAGAESVGFFMLSIIIISKVSIIPKTISSVLMPHISSLHASEGSFSGIHFLFIKSQALTICLTTTSVMIGYLLLKPIVGHLLPDYIQGVHAAKIILLAGIPYSLIYNANNILIALQYKRDYLKIFIMALSIQAVGFTVLLLHDVTIDSIAEVLFVVFSCYAIAVNLRVFFLNRKMLSQINI